MNKINLYYLAQLLDRSGMSYSLSRLENTITITVGDDEEHEYEVQLAIDGDTVWLYTTSISITSTSTSASLNVMQRLLGVNASSATPAKVGLGPQGEVLVMMALPILTQFGIAADSLKNFVLDFVIVVQEVIEMLEEMSSPPPIPRVFESRKPKFDVKHFRRLLEMRKRRLSVS